MSPFHRSVLGAAFAATALLALPAGAAPPSKVNPDLAQAARAQGQGEPGTALDDRLTVAVVGYNVNAFFGPDYRQHPLTQPIGGRVTGTLRSDSRQVRAGDGFIAWPGAAVDGRTVL